MSRWKTLGIGALSGLVAGLALTLTQALARLCLGVAPPAELLGDRVAPLLSIEQFFTLLRVFRGYDRLKQFGVGAGTLGQLAIAVLVGAGYAMLRARRRSASGLALVVGALWLLAMIVLWPVLPASFSGLPPGLARFVTMVVTAFSFALFAAVLAVTFRLMTGRSGRYSAPSVTRRALLVSGTGAGLALATGGVGSVLYRRATFDYDGMEYNGPGIQPITPNNKFYVVTKNVVDPQVRATLWRLTIGGAVDQPRTYDLADVRAMPAVSQETTLMCISNRVGGGLESNARWTGVPLRDLIAQAGPVDGVVEVLVSAVDGYTDTFSITKAMEPTTLLAYEMNGEPLPHRHGFPARIIVPGLFGEKNVKWVTRVDLVTEESKGFYERQGWGPSFVVPTRSRFTEPDLSRPLKAGTPVTLRGTALAGDRGVAKVEVSIDDGTSWQTAELEYSGSPLAWALWRYDWQPAQPGEYGLAVRATDRTGAVQTAQRRPSPPQGATGYHRVTARVVP